VGRAAALLYVSSLLPAYTPRSLLASSQIVSRGGCLLASTCSVVVVLLSNVCTLNPFPIQTGSQVTEAAMGNCAGGPPEQTKLVSPCTCLCPTRWGMSPPEPRQPVP